jgi:hypothetical protein
MYIELDIDRDLKCYRCKEYKDSNLFHKSKKSNRGRVSYCKDCTREYHREYRFKNPEKAREIERNTERWEDYKITRKEYEILRMNQDFCCAICGIDEDDLSSVGRNKVLSIDHNHNTGVVRGLLCTRCNRCIGMFEDNVEYLRNAIKYLENT